DGLGVDVVEPRWSASATRPDPVWIAESAAAVHAHAVHVHDRLVRLREAGGAADPDLGAFPGQATAGKHRYGRVAARELLGYVRDRRVAQCGGVDRGHGVPELALLGFGPRAGHDDHVERDRGLAQFEVGVCGLARADGRLLNDRSVPDPASAQLHLARAHAELIPAVGVREGAELGPGDVDLDAVHRAFGECVSHLPANRARALR